MNGLSYFLNQNNSLANDYCKLYFNFNTNSSIDQNIYNLSGLSNYRGRINSFQPSFWTKSSGSGFFSGQSVSITGNNDTGVNFLHNDATFCLVYEHFSPNGCILISTVETGMYNTFNEFGFEIQTGIFKGFNLGVTSNNRLFFEYYNNNSLEAYTSNFSLSQKASIFLTIFNNNANLGYYDFFQNRVIDESFFIQSDYLFDYSSIYLGKNNNLINTVFFDNGFTGFMDEFLVYSPSLYNADIVDINSGFAHIYNSGSLSVQDNSITGVTGYTSGITGFSTGITGTVLIATGVVNNEWGVQYTGFLESGVTGAIPLFDTFEMTGIITLILNTGVTGESILLNRPYINSFGKDVINYLSKVDMEDLLEMQTLSQNYSGYVRLKNIKSEFLPYLNAFAIPNLYLDNSDSFTIFVNGQFQNSGRYYLTGNGYISGKVLVNDYIINENKEIIFNNTYNENDSVFLDFVENYNTGLYIDNFSVPSGTGNFVLTGWNDNLNNIYFNGQKLVSGIHYVFSVNNIVFERQFPLFGGTTGVLSAMKKSSDSTLISSGGGNSYILSQKYLYNLSEIYKNGIRQTLDSDYLELAKLDTNTGVGFFDIKSSFIYNNEGLFPL